MKLTRRQQTFINRFLDLYRELNGPIHYSLLAERVGVSPFTAYDMLRLLEEKGYVTSEYRIGSEKPSVGRSAVVFIPTEVASRRIEELANGTDLGDWDSTKSRILARIRTGEFQDGILAEEMLARVPPDAPETLRYCFEVMMVLILRLGRGTGRHILIERLPQFLKPKGTISRSGLLLLGGFVLGLLANENAIDLDWDQSIIKQVERYQALVMEMEPRLYRSLGDGIKDMFALVLQS
jgi:DNA-binding Lrp family transcriptional regulator